MDKIEIIMFLGLSGFILFLFFYMLKRDKIVDSKLAAMELALEDLNQEIFKIKKEGETPLFNKNFLQKIKKF